MKTLKTSKNPNLYNMNVEKGSKYYLYYHIDPRTGFPAYIGKGSGNRYRVMYNRNYMHRIWVKELKKLNLEPFLFILKEFDSEKECLEVEKKEIAIYKKIGVNLLNIADGGAGGLSNVCKKPIVCISNNQVYDSSKLASELLNIPAKRICDVLKGRKLSYKGLKFRYVDEKLNKIPDIKREKAIYFNKHTTSKKIICIETNVVYESITKAAKELGVSSGAIRLVLRGKNKRVRNLTFRRL